MSSTYFKTSTWIFSTDYDQLNVDSCELSVSFVKIVHNRNKVLKLVEFDF